jgi:uncharacterized protein (TIGR03000 family)
MFRRIVLGAALGALLAPAAAVAQQGQDLFDWSGGWGRYARGSYSAPTYVLPRSPASSQPAERSRNTLEVAGRSEATAQVEVSLPADAELWFNGKKMKTMGAARRFETPPLRAGDHFSYDARASWKENGRTVTKTRQISISAGDVIHVSFTAPRQAK